MLMCLLQLAVAMPTMDASAVTHGQCGECRTVFEGHDIEPFAFEVKGTMRNFLGPKKDIILVRLLGPRVEFTGVVAGMSGSPCFIDGKLVGALSYAFATFAKQPIAGITPIASMLEVLELPDEPRPWRLVATQPQPAPDAEQLRPIATPLALAGIPTDVAQQFMPWLRGAGFAPYMAGGATGATAAPATPAELAAPALVPGGSLTGLLIWGDVDVAGTGTVTYVDGDRFLAFGHPFFGVGALSIPVAQASILNTMASQQRSFKMSSTGAIVGEIDQDRLVAIAGHLGRRARGVEVRGAITTLRGRTPFAFEVARDVVMTPRLVAMGVAGALGGRVDAGQRGLMRVDSTLRFAGHESVRLHGTYAAERDANLFGAAGFEIGQAMGLVWDAPFGPPPAVGVEVEAHFDVDPIVESVDALACDRAWARPGEVLACAVRLRRRGETHGARHERARHPRLQARRVPAPSHGEEPPDATLPPDVADAAPSHLVRFDVDVPRAWAGQRITVFAGGVEATERLVHDIEGAPQPQSRADVIRILRGRRHQGNLYLLITRAGPSLSRPGAPHAFLPPSSVALLASSPSAEGRLQGVAWERRRARPGVVDASAKTTVRVHPL